ncbi:DUF1326 domain-containing protein [Marinobacterium sp. D7]|uniref:DUF1326 domain-containing protein n=1 Tax=Marinobacterium ramblicola TaxID=2849041 RepID=UPI001C2D338F|nr:DUF1326 domain-containing protein [Marinobacterium ramblicola]MBV1786660.1 DUF1326 domain-containing protein [Marinobacterium ramblicola]
MSTEWKLEGDYMESCTCRDACPCLFMGSPTEGSCDALVGWHINKGQFGETALDNLNVVVALHSPGHMAEGNWKVVLYVDERADQSQRNALGGIFGGQQGGHPAMLASFIGEVLGMEYLPISYEGGQGARVFNVGRVAQAKLKAMEGQGGAEVQILNHPLAVAPGQKLTVAKSETLKHGAYGLDFEFSDRMAFYSPFNYTSAA